MEAFAVVPAAGVGKRLGTSRHKSFIPLRGRPILFWTLRALENSDAIRGIVVAAHEKDIESTKRLVARYRFRKVIAIVPGGATRTDSVYRGVQALPAEAQWVVVHDGARPLATARLIERTLQGAQKSGAAIAAVPIVPTVKEAKSFWVKRTLNRNHLWAVQTPQAFRRDLLEEAHRKARAKRWKATDDAALVEALGRRVRIIQGESSNLKVTTPEDLVVAEALLKDTSR